VRICNDDKLELSSRQSRAVEWVRHRGTGLREWVDVVAGVHK
jgi:hypothetical protein